MSSNVDKIVKLYRSLVRVPALTGAKLSNNGQIIYSIWSQRNLERGKTMKFLRSTTISNNKIIANSMPVDITNELLTSISPSEQYKAVIRDLNEKQYLEIWKDSTLSNVVDLTTLDVHGNVYNDGEFGSFQWAPDESSLIYIAEMKVPKSEPFYKRKPNKDNSKPKDDADTPSRGEEYLYRQDWGEQLVGKKKSVIVQYNLEQDAVQILTGIPDDICPAIVTYSPDGSYVVGIAYETEPRKLGLIYCSNRPSTIFTLDFNGNYFALPLEKKSVKHPIFTPDGKYLVWLQRNAGGPHAACLALMRAPLPLNQQTVPEVVVDVTKTEIQTKNGRPFYGLYNTNFSKHCFASENRILITTNQRNTMNSYVVDLDSGEISELINDNGSLIILDIVNDLILANRRNYLQQDVLLLGKLPPKNEEVSIDWTEIIAEKTIQMDNVMYEYLDLSHDNDDDVKNFSAIYVGPKSGEPKSVNLIVFPHGGPHSAFFNAMSLETSFYLKLGYGVVYVNFRGSTGAGQDTIEFLLGKIGTTDVADCMLAMDTVLEKYPWLNPDKVALVGGSHGGFLVTHLSGQFPERFKAVAARNPVIDVASMGILSDINDWSFVELGAEYTQVGPPDDDLWLAMRKASPIEHAHKVKAPTLLQIGSKDLRVPQQNSIEYYTRLKTNGVKVRMNLYDDNHPLSQVPNEIDNLINIALWFDEHLM